MAARPGVVFVMGVSGCGKTTVGESLAKHLSAQFIEGDAHHPPQNKEKMAKGVPLCDEDRWPWLLELCSQAQALSPPVFVSCSALKRTYREFLAQNTGDQAGFLFLKGSKETIARRLDSRVHEFMPAGLLDSQFRTLEEPSVVEEPVIAVDIDNPPDQVLRLALTSLREKVASVPSLRERCRHWSNESGVGAVCVLLHGHVAGPRLFKPPNLIPHNDLAVRGSKLVDSLIS